MPKHNKLSFLPERNDEEEQRHDVQTPVGVIPVRIEHLHVGTRGDSARDARDCHLSIVLVELGGHEALQGIVQRIQPVHEDPETREVARDNGKTAEKRDERGRHSADHCE